MKSIAGATTGMTVARARALSAKVADYGIDDESWRSAEAGDGATKDQSSRRRDQPTIDDVKCIGTRKALPMRLSQNAPPCRRYRLGRPPACAWLRPRSGSQVQSSELELDPLSKELASPPQSLPLP